MTRSNCPQVCGQRDSSESPSGNVFPSWNPLTDQGSNFVSKLMTEFYKLTGVTPIKTSVYHPQTDGMVERFNATLKRMLRKSVSKDAKDWDELLPFMLFAYRGAKHATTGFSPYELVYGREMRDTVDVLAEHWEDQVKMSCCTSERCRKSFRE